MPETETADTDPNQSQSARRVSLKENLSYGAGIIAFNFSNNGIKQLAYPIFGVTLGVSPAYIGIVLALSRVWDAFTDPLMGSISDNTRGRWGRRRPYILIGGILCSLVFAFMWFVPQDWSAGASSVYFLISCLIFYSCFTIYGVAYQSLGYELTPDYHERTKIMATRALYAKLIVFALPWVYRLAQLETFESTMQGMRILGVAIAIIMMLSTLPSVFFCRERYQKTASHQKKIKLLEAAKLSIKSKPFATLLAVTVLLQSGANTIDALGVYIGIYYVCDGDTVLAATYVGLGGTINAVLGLLSIPLCAWLSKRYGKTSILSLSLMVSAIGAVSKWFLFTPSAPWLMVLVFIFIAPAQACFWVLVNSMKADVCDYDEWKNGLRREGMFGAMATWIQKSGLALTFLISGLIVSLSGFDQEIPSADQEASILTMRILFTLIPALSSIVGVLLLKRYTLSERKLLEIRADLERRRGAV